MDNANTAGSGTMAITPEEKRIFFLDNLKSLAIVMVVVHHSAMAYMTGAAATWGIQDVRTSPLFDWFVAWDDTFIMPLMFFVSGYFAFNSISHMKSTTAFLKGKWFRIGWPWLTGVIFLAPVTYYVSFPASAPDFIAFIPKFWTGRFYPAQYWYLNALLWFYLVALASAKVFPRLAVRRDAPAVPGPFFFVFLAALGFAGMFAVNMFLADGRWCGLYILSIQWTRAPLYLLWFFCGGYAWRSRWFGEGGYSPGTAVWTVSAAVAAALYFLLRSKVSSGDIIFDPVALKLVDTSVRSTLCLVTSFAAISLCRKFADSASRFWKELSAAAFAVYWIQQPVVNVFSQLTRTWEFPCGVKFLLVAAATAAVSFLIARFVLLRLPFFAPAGAANAHVKK